MMVTRRARLNHIQCSAHVCNTKADIIDTNKSVTYPDLGLVQASQNESGVKRASTSEDDVIKWKRSPIISSTHTHGSRRHTWSLRISLVCPALGKAREAAARRSRAHMHASTCAH
eukprot:3426687-Alexandrium_andersonii.AAC.1